MAKTITSFKKGLSGNPKGAPRRSWTWSGELAKATEEQTKTGVSIKHLLAQSLVRQALRGNVHAANTIMDRMDGKPLQKTDVTSDGEQFGVIIYRPQRLDEE